MAKDHSLPLRRALVTALRGNSGVTALVGTRITGPKVDTNIAWPFIRVGVIIATPYDASRLSGMNADFAIHAFDRGGA